MCVCVCVCVQEHRCLMHVRGSRVREECNRSLCLTQTHTRVSQTLTHITAIIKSFRIHSYQYLVIWQRMLHEC
jgi:hypothetical protein